MKIAIVRFGNVFNSNGSVAEKFKTKLLKVKKISFFMDGYLGLVIFYQACIGYLYL